MLLIRIYYKHLSSYWQLKEISKQLNDKYSIIEKDKIYYFVYNDNQPEYTLLEKTHPLYTEIMKDLSVYKITGD
jgi:hypothetical protein